jgi:hypothetical protein
MKIKLALASLLVAAGLAAPASAHSYSYHPHAHHVGFGGPQWDFLGAREVNHFSEQDRIYAQGFRKYSQVRICVYNRAVRMQDVDVVFRNGGHQDLQVRHFLRPGECTRAIDLAGNRRDIRFLNLFYQTAGRNFGPKAVVRVFAR